MHRERLPLVSGASGGWSSGSLFVRPSQEVQVPREDEDAGNKDTD